VKWRAHWGVGNPLSKPLMRSSLVKGHDICLEKTRQLPFMQDQKLIQAFSSHTQEKTFVIWHSLAEFATAFEGP